MILLSYGTEMPHLKSGKSTVLGWVRNLYGLGKFRESTQFPTGLDLAEGNKTLAEEEDGKLRIDRQRVIGINERVQSSSFFRIRDKSQARGYSDYPTADAAQEALGRKKAKILEVKKDITVADYVWTLFACQYDETHNRVFVLNNYNLLGALGEDDWVATWDFTITNHCTAILTDVATRTPSGIDDAFAWTPG